MSSETRAVGPDPQEIQAAEVEPPAAGGAHALALTDGRLFGCTLLPVVDRSLIRRTTSEAVPEAGPVSVSVLRTLQPPIESLFVPSAEGLCEPRRGQGSVLPDGWGRPHPDGRRWQPVGWSFFAEVAERLADCTRMSTFAFANCEPPEWLRYERFRHHIQRLPRSGESDDPRVAALIEDDDAILRWARWRWPRGLPPEHFPADWRQRLRRRQRIASVALAAEELAVVETHWQIGDERCPGAESVTAGVFVRDPGGRWRRVETPRGLPVGVFHDGARVVGLDLLGRMDELLGLDFRGPLCGGAGPPPDPDSDGADFHDCHGAAIAARRDADGFALITSVYWGFSPGEHSLRTDHPPLLRDDEDCQD